MESCDSRTCDDLYVNTSLRPMADDGGVAAAVHPGKRHTRMRGSQMIENLLPASGILHRSRGNDHNKQEPQDIRGDVRFLPLIFLPVSIP